ncbi:MULTISPECIES: SH3 domain-containing protein [Streptomyces]|uniref:SH3 domain-containing protein n=1 Tax=Streptomyces TaxID=1883 RepID=UPI0021A53087|nr:SH3 domain-containing protein [Streptomyces atratus]MCT2544036.1 SH3 domain-containing protein [Streptomyces atratus]
MKVKRSTMLVVGVIAGSALTISAPAAGALSNSAPSAIPASTSTAASLDHVKFLQDGVNIRAEATTKSPSLGLAYKSHKANFLASVRGENVNGEFNWVKLKDTTTGVTGYVNAAYISLIP